MAALVPDIVIELGAIAGLAAFLGIAVLAILQFVQARDVRRLRDWAGRAPERDADFQEATAALAEARAEEMRTAADELPHGDPLEAEARAVQLRAARQRGRETSGGLFGGSRVAQAVLAVFAVAVVAGGTYLAVGAISGEDEEPAQRARGGGQARGGGGGGGGGGAARPQTLDPSQIQVAVLNGTAATGLASTFQAGVAEAGYQVGAVGNSQSTFSESSVMFSEGRRPEAVEFARRFEITKVEPMIEEVIAVAEGAPIAVVLGDDMVPTA